MATTEVLLFVYDLSKGLAKQLSLPLLGKQLDGIWHTSIVIFNREYFFGGGGIESCRPCGTILGRPEQTVNLGETQVNYSIFLEYLHDLGEEKYSGEKYDLFQHNCNTFSDEVATFLTGSKIPDNITALPKEVIDTPIGAMLKSVVDSMTADPISHNKASGAVNGVSGQGISQQAVEGEKDKSESATSATDDDPSADNIEDVLMERLRKERMQERSKLVLFEEVNPLACVEGIKAVLPKALLSEREITELENLVPCLLASDDDIYKPSITPAGFLVLGKLLTTVDVPSELLLPLCDLLQLVFLDPEIIREQKENDDHAIMTFIFLLQTYSIEVQVSVFRMLCNACSTRKGALWVKSEQEWVCTVDGMPTSNIQMMITLIVTSLLSTVGDLVTAAATLVYNMSRYNVNIHISEDFTIEVSSALIQCLTTELNEEATYRCLQALHGMATFGEVAGLMKMMGVDTARYSTLSERCTEICGKLDMAMSAA